ncbi:MAG: hypothetical protein KA885_14140 [Spirochaetes bacterium]|mgnify:CR=1 FL=1|nr:hypothetical protein [Spirochaetota bacterium]
MITYRKEELLSSSKVVREFSKLLNRLRSNSVEKIAVMRNNSIEAVIIPLNEYERLQETQDMIEHKEIYNIVK